MLESEKFAIAARLHVVLRRKLGRVTDVEWMVRNREYAAEVLRLSRAQEDAEILDLAVKFAAVVMPPVSGPKTAERPARSVSMPPPLADARGAQPASTVSGRNPLAGQPVTRYVGGLR